MVFGRTGALAAPFEAPGQPLSNRPEPFSDSGAVRGAVRRNSSVPAVPGGRLTEAGPRGSRKRMTVDAVALAEELNRSCHCIAVDPAKLQRSLESGPITAGVYAAMQREQPHLFSASPVFLARAHVDHMQAVIRAIESVIATAPFREWALGLAPEVARLDFGPRGAFLGYDFHLGLLGPQLIEINTNAGGGLLNAALARAQQACCTEVEAVLSGTCDPEALEQRFVDMFREEWRRQRGEAPLRRIAIVDEQPARQYLHCEFLLFRELFERAGLSAIIVDAADLERRGGRLWAGGEPVDMVYNRLTDFYLRQPENAALGGAYQAGEVVVTPNPRIYALYADKRHLTVLSDAALLRDWGIAPELIELLAASVPETRIVEAERREELWRERKRYFFKPAGGYGSKAAYRGDKLTRTVWESMPSQPYVAQRLVPPSQRTIRVDGEQRPLKLDLRNYVYAGEVQLVAARLYQGQTTNFRTPGGGFAPVFTENTG